MTLAWRRLLALYVPLMFSGLLMSVEGPLITAGIARQPQAELFLAAFGVAFAIALVYEAPILMVLEASIALGNGWPEYLTLRRAYLGFATILTALGLAFFFTPAYTFLTRQLMSIPESIVIAARPALMILTFWPLPIGWRRLHQGVLIRHARTNVISFATGVRVALLSAILFGGAFRGTPGAVLGAGAMVAGVTVEALLITVPALAVLGPRNDARPRSGWERVWSYYRPLATTALLQQANRPLITTGIAASMQAVLSLAAWPVVVSITMLANGPLSALQQVVIAVPDDPGARRRTASFVLAVGGFLTALLVIITSSSLLEVLLVKVFGVSSEIWVIATPAARILAFLPLVIAAQCFLRGTLIRAGNTMQVQRAMLANLLTVALIVGTGMALRNLPGIMLGALALLLGGLAEVAVLWRSVQTERMTRLREHPVQTEATWTTVRERPW